MPILPLLQLTPCQFFLFSLHHLPSNELSYCMLFIIIVCHHVFYKCNLRATDHHSRKQAPVLKDSKAGHIHRPIPRGISPTLLRSYTQSYLHEHVRRLSERR